MVVVPSVVEVSFESLLVTKDIGGGGGGGGGEI
jgi:hypothetical protein